MKEFSLVGRAFLFDYYYYLQWVIQGVIVFSLHLVTIFHQYLNLCHQPLTNRFAFFFPWLLLDSWLVKVRALKLYGLAKAVALRQVRCLRGAKTRIL